jgi:hypothetical protein
LKWIARRRKRVESLGRGNVEGTTNLSKVIMMILNIDIDIDIDC